MTHYDLAIIGTGSGNSILDRRFADLKTAVVEHGTFGGTCLNVGCIPTKMFVHTADLARTPSYSSSFGVDEELTGVRWPEIRDRIFGRVDPIAAGGEQYREHHADNANVTVYHGTGRFTAGKELTVAGPDGQSAVITADRFVLAAGSRPIIPSVPGLADADYHTSDTIMRLDELPARLAIVGSGFVAAEFAHVFSSLGVEVTLIARSGLMLRHEDTEIAARYTELASAAYDVRLNHDTVSVLRREDGAIVLETLSPGGRGEIVVDEVLVAIGRRPNSDLLEVTATGVTVHEDERVVVDAHQRTVVDGIYAIGDLSSPYQLKHVANHEARVVQHNLLHPSELIASDHRYVPSAVFGSPQIASIGLTEQKAREQGISYVVGRAEYAGVAYGWALENTTGFAKLLADPATGLLLGAHIIGPQASSILQPIIQAMSFGLDAHTMARGQYWIHPALPELIENALLNLPLDKS